MGRGKMHHRQRQRQGEGKGKERKKKTPDRSEKQLTAAAQASHSIDIPPGRGKAPHHRSENTEKGWATKGSLIRWDGHPFFYFLF